MTTGQRYIRDHLPCTAQFDDPKWWAETGNRIDELECDNAKLRALVREMREAINPIVDPTVTVLNVDGTLDLMNAARKADELLSSA